MNALDSSLEGLAFNYLSYIWTWVALLTAAVGFCRIRASSELPRGEGPHGSSQNTVILEAAISEPAEQEKTTLSFKNVPFCAWDREGGTKGKFTLYYCDEKDGEKCGNNYYEGGVIGDDDNGGENGE